MRIPARNLLNPFRLHYDPMERLLLVNFEGDPDTAYIGLEPQVFDDDLNGCGHLVIAWRTDGKVDVYHQDSLRLDPAKYDIAGKGLANMVAVPFEHAHYEVAKSGVQAHYAFTDIQGREVLIRIEEGHARKRAPFGLLAPMGDAAEAPSAMPLVLLHDFYFVRKRHTLAEVRIGGKQHRVDEMPLPMDFTKMYFARYSPRPLIITFNPAMDGPLHPLNWDGQSAVLEWEGHELVLAINNGQPSIQQLVRHNPVHPVCLAFDPPFPDVRALLPGELCTGRFTIEAHPSVGRIDGDYWAVRKDDKAEISLRPSGGWRPKVTKLSTWLIYNMMKMFKHWPKTYEWTAVLQLDEADGCQMASAWERKRQ